METHNPEQLQPLRKRNARSSYRHVIGMFEVGLQNGHVLSLDKDYILKFCDDFCKYANLPQRTHSKQN